MLGIVAGVVVADVVCPVVVVADGVCPVVISGVVPEIVAHLFTVI